MRDAVTHGPVPRTLQPSLAHLLTTPLSAPADWVTCFDVRQLASFLLWFVLSWFGIRAARQLPWRGAKREALGFAVHLGGVLAFAAWTVLLPRPVARLQGPGSAVDLHSHTSFSWDARRFLTPERSLAWHKDLGFDAAFVTDHNVYDGAALAFEKSKLARYPMLRGEELSLDGAHVVVLGNKEKIDPAAYPGPEGLRRFLGESRRRWGALAVLSLPEYWKNHQSELSELAAAGAAGLELANGSPKAGVLGAGGVAKVSELCRARDLFLAGVTDNHGWAQSACAATLLDVPPSENGEAYERAILNRLGEGYASTIVAERPIVRADSLPALAVNPWVNLWQCLRTLNLGQAAVCLLYIAVATALIG